MEPGVWRERADWGWNRWLRIDREDSHQEFQGTVRCADSRPGRDLPTATGRRGRVGGWECCKIWRLSEAAGEQSGGRGGGGHARSLARLDDNDGLRGRKGRLCREAANAVRARRALDDPRSAAL